MDSRRIAMNKANHFNNRRIIQERYIDDRKTSNFRHGCFCITILIYFMKFALNEGIIRLKLRESGYFFI